METRFARKKNQILEERIKPHNRYENFLQVKVFCNNKFVQYRQKNKMNNTKKIDNVKKKHELNVRWSVYNNTKVDVPDKINHILALHPNM